MSFAKNFLYELVYGSVEDSKKDEDIEFKIDEMLKKEPKELILMKKTLEDFENYVKKENLTEHQKNKIKVFYEDLKSKLLVILSETPAEEKFFENLYVFLRLFMLLDIIKQDGTNLYTFYKTFSNVYAKVVRRLKIIDKEIYDKRLMIEIDHKIEKTLSESLKVCDKYKESKDFIVMILTSDFVSEEVSIFKNILNNLEYIFGECAGLEEKYKRHHKELYANLLDYLRINFIIYNTVNKYNDIKFQNKYDISRWLKYYDIEIKQSEMTSIENINENSLNILDRDFEKLYEILKNEETEDFLYEDRKNYYKRLHYLTIKNQNVLVYNMKFDDSSETIEEDNFLNLKDKNLSVTTTIEYLDFDKNGKLVEKK